LLVRYAFTQIVILLWRNYNEFEIERLNSKTNCGGT